jgi:hypothetical protein
MGTWSFPGVKAAGPWCWPHTPSSAEVKKELNYTSTHPLGPSGSVTGFHLPYEIHWNTQFSVTVCYTLIAAAAAILVLSVKGYWLAVWHIYREKKRVSFHKWSPLEHDKTLYHQGVDKQFHSPMVACGVPLKLPFQSKVKFQFAFKFFQQDSVCYTRIPQPVRLNCRLVRKWGLENSKFY